MSNTQPKESRLESKVISVLDSEIHYVEAGEGDPILFLHGIPTSSYLWRNIIPQLSLTGRCIAPDLIGMGLSGKPNLEYTIHEHIRYIEEFINLLNLENMTIVMHAWGSLVGFHYAVNHPQNIKGLAFLEAYVRPISQEDVLALPMQERASILEGTGDVKDQIINHNYYVQNIMPDSIMRSLSDEEKTSYAEPFLLPGSGKPIWQYLQELPTGSNNTPASKLIEDYSSLLTKLAIPKLMLYAMPGFNTSLDTVQWAKNNFEDLTIVEIDDALHYAQETHPKELADAIESWLKLL